MTAIDTIPAPAVIVVCLGLVVAILASIYGRACYASGRADAILEALTEKDGQ